MTSFSYNKELLKIREAYDKSNDSFEYFTSVANEEIEKSISDANEYSSKIGITLEYSPEYDFSEHEDWVACIAFGEQDDASVFPIAINLEKIYDFVYENGSEYDEDEIRKQIRISIFHELGHAILNWISESMGVKIPFDDEESVCEEFGKSSIFGNEETRLSKFVEKYIEDEKIVESEEAENSEIENTSFNVNDLNSMTSFQKRVAYCRKFLKYLGRGSSRMAFMMDNGHVLKLAFNRKGIAQNQTECGDYYKSGLYCFTNCFNTADDYTWCEVEAASKCKLGDFKRLLGYTFDEITDVLVQETRDRGNPMSFKYYRFKTSEQRAKEIIDAVWENPDDNYVLYSMFDYIGNYGATEALVTDFFTIKNWGIVNRDGNEVLVVTDSGLNDDVWNTHYNKFRG